MKCDARITSGLLALAMLPLAGCSDGGLETVPVYGKVSFAGRNAPDACRLYFQPIKSESISRPASTTADADGSYEAKAFRDSDGLMPGTYKVQVSYFDLKPGANPDLDTSYTESTYDAGELVVDSDEGEIERNIEVPMKTPQAETRRP
jgi:hypothetical protein